MHHIKCRRDLYISGVTQGYILGPILFTVFVNDLDSDVVNGVWKFADDAK